MEIVISILASRRLLTTVWILQVMWFSFYDIEHVILWVAKMSSFERNMHES